MAVFTFKLPSGEQYDVQAGTQQEAVAAWQQFQSQLPQPEPENPNEWRRGVLAPIEKNTETGEIRPAVPQILHDAWSAVTLPGEVARGEVPELDPRMPMEEVRPQTWDRVNMLGGLAAPSVVRGGNPLELLTPAKRRALANMTRAIEADQIPLNQVNQRLADVGQDAMAMDIGTNTQQLAGGIASLPGQGRAMINNAVNARSQNVGPRIQQDVTGAFGTGDAYVQVLDDMVKAQQTASKPIYDAVRPMPVQTDGNMRLVFGSDYGKQAIAEVNRILSAQGRKVDLDNMTVEVADLIKRQLDDMAQNANKERFGTRRQAIESMARVLREAVDKQVPEYAIARDTFAGHAALQEALDVGRNIFSKNNDPFTFKRTLDNASTSEREAILTGARTAIEDALGNAINDAAQVRNFLRRSNNQQKLTQILGKDAVDDLIRGMEREMLFGQTKNVATQNSQTASRLAAMADVSPNEFKSPGNETIFGTIKAVFDGAINRLRGGNTKQANVETARLLTDGRLDEAALMGATRRQPQWYDPAGNASTRATLVQVPEAANDALYLALDPASRNLPR